MPRLSDQERQEVMRYLEADQPLPEKYRFLLFADKRQVELVWNGKTNTVCNVVLPFQTIEQVDEPRAEQPLEAMEEPMQCLAQWITDPNALQSDLTDEFLFLDEAGFANHRPRTFAQLLQSFLDLKAVRY
jgi:hypothetical protein